MMATLEYSRAQYFGRDSLLAISYTFEQVLEELLTIMDTSDADTQNYYITKMVKYLKDNENSIRQAQVYMRPAMMEENIVAIKKTDVYAAALMLQEYADLVNQVHTIETMLTSFELEDGVKPQIVQDKMNRVD